MRYTSTDEIRDIFLNFFRARDHLVIPGSSVLADDDPTLLYINAGMAPLKPYFLGGVTPPSPRLANVQACIRTRDIEDVGDRHHLTFFEMLGSWSIGDYFKDVAIELALELLVDGFGFPIERLYATVFDGDPSLPLPADDESAAIWQRAGLPADHIVPLGIDNFWGPAGDTGPCGPCTEVFFDTGDTFGHRYVPGGEFDTNRYLEIWNAGVFMAYDKRPDGSFVPLPFTSVDTGAGLERVQLAMNGYGSLYETDLLQPIVAAVTDAFGRDVSDRDRRVIADHVRAATFILAEGVVPGNTGRGYIPRRLIRKCVALALRCGQPSQHLGGISDVVVDLMHRHYPHLAEQRGAIADALQREIDAFGPTVERGLSYIDRRLAQGQSQQLPGEVVFEMVATYGLPLEILAETLRSREIDWDEDAYWTAFRHHQQVSREGLEPSRRLDAFATDLAPTAFSGYEQLSDRGTILVLAPDPEEPAGEVAPTKPEAKGGSPCATGDHVLIVADRTPFYAEAGGQVGDTGSGITDTGVVQISDTTREDDVFIHHGTVASGTIEVGQGIRLDVDTQRRVQIARNHSSTHLLQAALRKVLGPHIAQQGSRVGPDRLRFDFQHDRAVSEAELRTVEALVNGWIRDNLAQTTQVTTYDEAVSTGATALFDEYGEVVRIVSFEGVNRELCGGTHVRATGDIGLFLITNERSVSRGTRRIEAVTGDTAGTLAREALDGLHAAARALRTSPDQLPAALERLLRDREGPSPASVRTPHRPNRALREEIVALVSGIKVEIAHLDVSPTALRDVAEMRLETGGCDAIVAVTAQDDKLTVAAIVSAEAQPALTADKLLRALLPLIDGSGGGNARIAMGGTKDAARLTHLLTRAPAVIAPM